jgi:hypothetical protein
MRTLAADTMRLTLPALAALFLLLPHALAAQSAAPWSRGGSDAAAYAMDARGSATDSAGASVLLRSTGATDGFGSTGSSIPADSFRLGRVRLSGEVRTRGAIGGASLWLRVDGEGRMLLLDNGLEQRLRGDAGWVRQQVTLPIPREATRIVFGSLLYGTGSVEVRRLRVEASPRDEVFVPLPDSVQLVLDSAIAIVKAHALWRDTVTWSVVEPEVRALASGAADVSGVLPAIRVLLMRLGDNHSLLLTPRQSAALETAGARNPPVTVQLLRQGIGYLAMPGYLGGDTAAARAYVTSLHASLERVRRDASCGWIVDLRSNGGGSMVPMLAGLKPFLGEGPLGLFVGVDGRRTEWKATTSAGSESPATLAPLESAYVAVITGPRTASSGEVIAISFRGRARTRSFGTSTAGLSTGNDTFPLPGGATIVLTTVTQADRSGRSFGGTISPDSVVSASARAAAAGDSAAIAAARWLRERGSCRGQGSFGR